MLYREKAVRQMEAWAREGVRETSTNWGGRITTWLRRMGLGPTPWCQVTVCEAFRLAGASVYQTATVSYFWNWAKPKGYTFPRGSKQPIRGDVICFEWDGNLSTRTWDILDHVGMVRSVTSDGWVNTVEGNAADAVRFRSYRLSDRRVIGYIRIPGDDVDPSLPGPPYVTQSISLPRLIRQAGKEAGQRWAVRFRNRIVYRGQYKAAKRERDRIAKQVKRDNKNRR